MKDHYKILRVSRKADEHIIFMACRILKQEFDPSNVESGDATKYAEVMDAYRVLSDPKIRAEYVR